MTPHTNSRAVRFSRSPRIIFPGEGQSQTREAAESFSNLVRAQLTRRAGTQFASHRALRVLKFGGTSMGDPAAITSVCGIVRDSALQGDVVVVVSAMSGVTNQLLEAAALAKRGDHASVSLIFEALRKRHSSAASALVHSPAERERLARLTQDLFQEGERLCRGTLLLGELTPRVRDSISSLGERLAAPLLSAVLSNSGTPSEAWNASKLIVTNSNHGAADPWMELTAERCESSLRPLLERGIIPVVTGFIGATLDGTLTTLGRGGSDYSASIIGAALGCDEIIIWTDVDGMLTSDPRVVAGARPIPEISYREAAELAYFGAKVLHPKTIRAVTQSGIPVWIRNTFAAGQPGTKITPSGPARSRGVKAVTAAGDVALITIAGKGIIGVPDVLGRTFAATARENANVLLISHSSSQNEICLVVASHSAQRTVEALRFEFAQDLQLEETEHISLDQNVGIITVVGQDMRGVAGIMGRAFGALGRKGINVIAIAQGTSDCNLSFAVGQGDVTAALNALHREFRLATGSRISKSSEPHSAARAKAASAD